MSRPGPCLVALGVVSLLLLGTLTARAQTIVSPVRLLTATGYADEDDMCFWLHPTNLTLSTVIASDKSADTLFVYELAGNTLQTIPTAHPGNSDVRYNFPFGGQLIDIIAFNDRAANKIRVYQVDRSTRLLTRIDNDLIATGPNYGFTLYRSPFTGKVY